MRFARKRPDDRTRGIYWMIEILDDAGAPVRVLRIPGYRPTVHRFAQKFVSWESRTGYQLRRVRDNREVDGWSRDCSQKSRELFFPARYGGGDA